MSIGENISFGADQLGRPEMEELARKVQIHQEILTFPSTYDTLVGERGVTLSGGQKQRVAIARALAMDPKILVLDDALSSVDLETEAALLSEVIRRREGRTNIIIAHRVSAVRHADLIIVLDQGRVIDRGTHEELIRREGFYKELFLMQQLEEEVRRAPVAETR
jgi:ATP-binding cassette subfamily B multidrug efflux pump